MKGARDRHEPLPKHSPFSLNCTCERFPFRVYLRVILRSGRAVGPWYPKFEKENPFCIAGVLAATEPLPVRSVRVEGSVVRVEGSAVRVEG